MELKTMLGMQLCGGLSEYHASHQLHYNAICCILHYLKGALRQGLWYKPSASLYMTGINDANWVYSHSNKLSTSSYCTKRILLRGTGKSRMLLVYSILHDLGVDVPTPMQQSCDDLVAIFITNNHVFHELTKHIEVDCHFIRDLLMRKQIVTPYIGSDDQLGDIFTKLLDCISSQQ